MLYWNRVASSSVLWQTVSGDPGADTPNSTVESLNLILILEPKWRVLLPFQSSNLMSRLTGSWQQSMSTSQNTRDSLINRHLTDFQTQRSNKLLIFVIRSNLVKYEATWKILANVQTCPLWQIQVYPIWQLGPRTCLI